MIVDDHAGFRAQARRLLESEGYRVIGEAADSSSGLEAARTLEPALALVDICLPGEDGLKLTSRLLALPVAPEVILISSHDSTEFGGCIAASGARGFIPKAELSREAIEETLG